MEESAAKRRRTTPPERSDTEDAPDATSRLNRNRPSFASPTKASMARHNPEILERRRSASPPKSVSPLRSPARRRPARSGSDFSATAPPAERAPDAFLASDLRRPEEPEELVEDEPEEREAEEEPTSELPPAATLGMRAAPRRSLNIPSPRPFPPRGPEGEDDMNPFVGRTRRRSPRTGISIPPPPEPELPPSVPDPISSTPPKGIHSSPSRRRSGNKPKKNSPLKQPPLRISDEPRRNSSLLRFLQRRSEGASQPVDVAENDGITRDVRGVPRNDSNADKRAERDSLRDELARLRKDLDAITRENDRIRSMQSSGRTLSFLDDDALLDIVKRQILPDDPDLQPKQYQFLAQAALDPTLLMAYKKPPKPLPTSEDDIDISSIKSHYPVPMSTAEALPYLQLFGAFNVTSSLVVLPEEPDQPIRQRLTLNLRSKHQHGLFNARVEAVIDAMKLSILSLSVPLLDPVARPELGPFLESICNGDGNRSMQRNVGIASWAMADWLRIAEQRAHFWSKLHKDTATKEVLAETNGNVRTRKSRRSKQDSIDSIQEGDGDRTRAGKGAMLRFMGQQSLDISVPDESGAISTLRLGWKIEFDWTGEAQSKLSATAGVPGKWHKIDGKGSLKKLPSLFKKLVEGGEGPAAAARKMVALLVGEE